MTKDPALNLPAVVSTPFFEYCLFHRILNLRFPTDKCIVVTVLFT